MRKFQPVVRKARLGVPGYSPEAMLRIAGQVNSSIGARMDRGQDVYDHAALPLSERYAKLKLARGGSPIRNLRLTGRTRRGMRPLSAGQNVAVLGFSDPVALNRVILNNRKSRQYGMSPTNVGDFLKAIKQTGERPVQIVSAA